MDNESGIWVPAEQLAQAERERDEARHERDEAREGRAEWEAVAIKYLPYKRERDEALLAHGGAEVRCAEALEMAEKLGDRLEQATALLREWREDDGLPAATHTSKRGRTDAFLAGQPAPAKPVVDDAMVFRLCAELHYRGYNIGKQSMRAALVGALEGKQ